MLSLVVVVHGETGVTLTLFPTDRANTTLTLQDALILVGIEMVDAQNVTVGATESIPPMSSATSLDGADISNTLPLAPVWPNRDEAASAFHLGIMSMTKPPR